MARPSSYDQTKDYEKLADEYLQTCGRLQTKLPKISEFCREYIGVSEDTVNLWMKGENLPKDADTTELVGAIKRVKEIQKEQLIDDGSYGGKEVNSTMMIFLLKANHGMIETERRELIGKDGNPIQLSIKLDVSGGYLPQLERIATTSNPSYSGSPQVQSIGMAQESTKDDNGINRIDKTSAV